MQGVDAMYGAAPLPPFPGFPTHQMGLAEIEASYNYSEPQKKALVRSLLMMLDRPSLERVVDIFQARIGFPPNSAQDAAGKAPAASPWPAVPTAAPNATSTSTFGVAGAPPPNAGKGDVRSGTSPSAQEAAKGSQRTATASSSEFASPSPAQVSSRTSATPQADQEGPVTTLLLRNLPTTIAHEDALQWLDSSLGLKGRYDFFVLLPVRQGAVSRAALINFVNPRDLERARTAVSHAQPMGAGLPKPSSVISKQQGFDTNYNHYENLQHFVRLKGTAQNFGTRSHAGADKTNPPPRPAEPVRTSEAQAWASLKQDRNMEAQDDNLDDDGEFTTVILRNIPHRYDQESAMKWIDTLGFKSQYDFFLWFPAKMATRRWHNCGYAFINFKKPEDAKHFQTSLHGIRIDDEGDAGDEDDAEVSKGRKRPPLSVTKAKIQGFLENFDRFRYLLDSSATCIPHFDLQTVAKNRAFERPIVVEAAPRGGGDGDDDEAAGDKTTLMIRNLSDEFSQQSAMAWLDSMGFEDQYDFFIWFPAKQSQKKKQVYRTFGYAFVNFLTCEEATKCLELLKEYKIADDDRPPVNACYAKVQGHDSNVDHFRELESQGRCRPYFDARAPHISERLVQAGLSMWQ